MYDLRHSPHASHKDWQCPVCLQTASFPISTNCGHLFCGTFHERSSQEATSEHNAKKHKAPCLIAYWRHSSWLGAISCPLCRQKVTVYRSIPLSRNTESDIQVLQRVNVLYHLFRESRTDRQHEQVLGDIRDYNKRFSGARRQVTDYLYDMPLFVNLLLRGLGTMGGLVGLFFLRVTVCCFGTIISLASSVEAVAEPFCGILGLLDDIAVIFLLVVCVINIGQQIQPPGAAVTQSATRDVLADSS
ncbi:E3 ubiquitin-protein ligase RNF170-like [Scleropages formosus]|uniref:E3 ubiquitin-protein ligase RNF170-like n=1 Tax=Scleropages formosus TaxID=113540 RepID=A0A0N8K1M9_SCLFO|nr:E3 ubiquitin-protein ligase RNF170-like [Scleropages formosus]